ncbi:MAG: hypothetical protein JWM11_5018 [Planctomycetaceae bacterium]|nr:hypothetical protein [Planctomycetaceae bacterium]
MAYEDVQDSREQIPPLPPRRSVDDELRETEYERRSTIPNQPSGWGCSKGCLYGMAGCGCLTVILVAVAGFGLWQTFKGAFSTDPLVVAATAREIADFDVPVDLKPVGKMEFWFFKIVEFNSEDGESSLRFAQLDPRRLPGGKAQEINFNQGREDEQRKLEILKSELREMKIRGENAKVNFAEAKDPATGREYRLITAKFKGKLGPAEFQMQMPKEKYKEEDVKKFINQIK